jgi:hypothetical protein
MFSELKGYDDFPKNEEWIRHALEQILRKGQQPEGKDRTQLNHGRN